MSEVASVGSGAEVKARLRQGSGQAASKSHLSELWEEELPRSEEETDPTFPFAL